MDREDSAHPEPTESATRQLRNSSLQFSSGRQSPPAQRVKNGFVPDPCAFCGSMEPLTREHIFGQWVSKIGLDLSPVRHRAGPLNGMPRDMGERLPYRQTVKAFCASCNNGWMRRLEVAAQRVPTPLILGGSATIVPAVQAVIATWVQKTALTAMLISSKKQRESGYSLPQGEYTALYERRDLMQPLDASWFWVGRYEGVGGILGRPRDTAGYSCSWR